MRRIGLLIGLLLCFATYAKQTISVQSFNFAQEPDVKAFIKYMVNMHHFKKADLTKLFSAVKRRPVIIHSIQHPLEKTPWYIYKKVFLTESCIEEGVRFWHTYRDILTKAEKQYGVPASIIVATLGVETRYGKNTGEYPVIDALVNLAFSNTSRATYFRKELEEFLLLSREQHLNPLTVMGSYAGAIGEPQFMPSSYRHYAVNFSGNKNIDLSHNQADIMGSIAHYYQQHGWEKNQPVAVPFSIAGGKFQFSLKKPKPISLAELIEYQLTPTRTSNPSAQSLIILQTRHGADYWLGFHNFDVIKRYNPNDLYAMAVYQLSYYLLSAMDSIGTRGSTSLS